MEVNSVILVQSICIVHLTGDLSNDGDARFSEEFYRALSVVCDDLFFARYRRDTAGGANESEALLAAMFGDADVEDKKADVVEDLLDTRLLPANDGEGVHLSKDRLDKRWTS